MEQGSDIAGRPWTPNTFYDVVEIKPNFHGSNDVMGWCTESSFNTSGGSLATTRSFPDWGALGMWQSGDAQPVTPCVHMYIIQWIR